MGDRDHVATISLTLLLICTMACWGGTAVEQELWTEPPIISSGSRGFRRRMRDRLRLLRPRQQLLSPVVLSRCRCTGVVP
ncbi:hypothetical protein BDV97DRAFT_32622 [Delphinella strobiligena]|nr:hypothetical protein BDV97DRAFT_32622 [Delphinella strobiligena]